jgi:hypothetical protein
MHAGSALGYPPPKITAFVRSVVAEFITVTISKWEIDSLNNIFHSGFKLTFSYFCVCECVCV